MENTKTNEARYAADADVPVTPNVLNDTLPAGGNLSMGVVENTKINKSQYAADADATLTAATTNTPASEAT